MKTLLFITRFELRHSIKTGKVWIFGLILFLLAFLLLNIFAGAFDSVKIGVGGDTNKLNSPFMLSLFFAIINLLGLIIIAVLSGKMALKDTDYDSTSLSYSLPVSKFHFLAGKFLAAFLLCLFVFSCAALGIYAGTLMPYLDPVQFGPFSFAAYLLPFLKLTAVNVFFLSALFFMLGSVYRNYFINWLAIILLYGLYYASTQLARKPELNFVANLLDPFGFSAVTSSDIGVTSEQLNEGSSDPNYVVLFNRMLWIAIGTVCFVLAYIKFSFRYSRKKTKKEKQDTDGASVLTGSRQSGSPVATTLFSAYAGFRQFLFLIRYEWSLLFRNFYFKVILFIGFIILLISSFAIGELYGTDTYPVSYSVSEVFLAAMRLFLYVVITIFSGEMIWKDRSLKAHLVGDALPVSTSVSYFSKFVALTGFVFAAHLFLIVFGLFIQFVNGYTHYEPEVYLQTIIGIGFFHILFTIGLAFFVQAVVSNRFTGYFIMLAYFCFKSFLAGSVLEDNTFSFNASPEMQYSDMNHFGYNVPVFVLYKFYWLGFIALLLILGKQLYPKGVEIGFRQRFRLLSEKILRTSFKYPVIILSSVFLLCGGFIYYNVNTLNKFENAYSQEQRMATYEKNFSLFRNSVQPQPVDVSVNTDLYPESGALNVQGNYWLKNLSAESISELFINPMEADSVWFSVPATPKITTEDFHSYTLPKALAPGDSIQLFFQLSKAPKGFGNSGVESHVEKNGTFFHSDLFPSIGYNESMEIQSNSSRRKFGLKEKTSFARPVSDKNGLATNMLGAKSLIRFEMTGSTSADQQLLAPGDLVKKWSKGNRNYFTYKSSRPINNYYSILSAHYEVKKEVWESGDSLNSRVQLAVYHHPLHVYNTKNMMDGMKEALSYYHSNFSPFQYKELRIVEFPRYATFAQSFPGNIPFSEGIGFIADLRNVSVDSASVMDDNVTIDYPFYVTAHEVAHQWWAHQVCAADVEGASFIIETLSQYSALMVMKHHYGEEKMRKFLNQEAFSYLSSRSGGLHTENPLLKVAGDEQEVYYRKGSVIMYALQDYIGEDTVNKVLRDFIGKYAFKNAPYPTAKELVSAFEKVTPDSLKYIINDWFKNITLYNNKVIKASYSKSEDLEYTIDLSLDIHKFSYDKKGSETEVAVNDYIEIGVYNTKQKQVLLEKVKVTKGLNRLSIKLGRKPETLILDPYNKLLDKDWTMKRITVEKKS